MCGNNDYGHVEMSTKDNNKLKYNHGEKSLKVPFTIYETTILSKQSKWILYWKKSYAWTFWVCIRFNLFIWFKTKQTHNFYRGKDCIKKFCSDLKELGTKIVNYEQKEMADLTTDDVFLYESQKVCHICTRGS